MESWLQARQSVGRKCVGHKMLQVSSRSYPSPSMRLASPPPSASWQHRQIARPTLLQHGPISDCTMSSSCSQRRSSLNRRGIMDDVSPHREHVEQTLPSKSLQRRPPSPCREENAVKKKDRPSKEDGIMADALQDLKFMEKLLLSNLDQGDTGNSEVHRTLFKSLVHLRNTLVPAPEVGSASSSKPISWCPVPA